jgi:hypothetical protein
MKPIINWENYFQDAILSVEEFLNKNSDMQKTKSKLKIALENNFMTWFEYKEWAKDYYGYPIMLIDDPQTILHLQKKYQKHRYLHSEQNIWTDDLIALDQWDDQLIVIGLEPSVGLKKIPNHIFIFCAPDLLKLITQETIAQSAVKSSTQSSSVLKENETKNIESDQIKLSIPEDLSASLPDLELLKLDLEQTADEKSHKEISENTSTESLGILSFDEISKPVQLIKLDESANMSNQENSNTIEIKEETNSLFGIEKEPKTNLNDRIWSNLAEHHDSYALKVRKQFDAYLVLKITSNETTEVYRMDEDINFKVFQYDLKKQNPFQNVYQNHFTETFNISQLGLKILDFKYVCVSVIKLGSKVVGFLVGFKTTHLSQEDISTLESISEKVS